MFADPIRYIPSVEVFDLDEAKTIRELNEAFDVILEKTAADYGHAVRAVHAKSHGIMEGEFDVDDGLPPELAQGIFATPSRHKAYLRMSTNAGDILPDTISLPRGMALKVVNITGKRLSGSEGTAQDFVMVNGKVFAAKKTTKFLGNLRLLSKTTGRMEGTKKLISATLQGARAAFEGVGLHAPAVINALGGAPNSEPLGETYYSTTPFRYGDFMAKFSLAPVTPAMQALSGKVMDVDGSENAIREQVQKQVRSLDTAWEFRVQLCRDLEKQPIEDPTIEWDEVEAPFQRVALLRISAQDSWDAARVERINERMRFSPWTGITAHRPLGNINRARYDTYRHSADFRARANHCPYQEP